MITWRYSDRPRAPSTRPARRCRGGMWSTPAMTPLAMAGPAPRTTTKRIAVSLRPKSRMASGKAAMGTSRAWMPAGWTSRLSGGVGVVVSMSERGLAIARRRSLGGKTAVEGGTITARRAMAAHLLAKTLGDFGGHGRHFGRLEAT